MLILFTAQDFSTFSRNWCRSFQFFPPIRSNENDAEYALSQNGYEHTVKTQTRLARQIARRLKFSALSGHPSGCRRRLVSQSSLKTKFAVLSTTYLEDWISTVRRGLDLREIDQLNRRLLRRQTDDSKTGAHSNG